MIFCGKDNLLPVTDPLSPFNIFMIFFFLNPNWVKDTIQKLRTNWNKTWCCLINIKIKLLFICMKSLNIYPMLAFQHTSFRTMCWAEMINFSLNYCIFLETFKHAFSNYDTKLSCFRLHLFGALVDRCKFIYKLYFAWLSYIFIIYIIPILWRL